MLTLKAELGIGIKMKRVAGRPIRSALVHKNGVVMIFQKWNFGEKKEYIKLKVNK